LRELLTELRERGIEVSYFGVWHFVDHLGLSFKKKPPRQRTRSA
jgi:transposase